MRKIKISLLFFVILFLIGLSSLIAPSQTLSAEKNVYVIPVEKSVEKGLSAYLNRSITEAEENDADLIILEINTPGGAVNAATEISERITNTSVPIIAFINNKALSAGAFIALNADEIYMTPDSTIGSAAIIDHSGNAASNKAQSYWHAAMRSAAELNGRDPIFALAMADDNIDLSEYNAGKGSLLTLTAEQALKVNYAEGIVSNKSELLNQLGFQDANVKKVEMSIAEKIARFLTNPIVIPILITIGIVGLIIELFSPGFGIPGLTGLAALFLFFFGHLVAGLAGFEVILLFIAGIFFIIVEFFVIGGILGFLGFVAIIASLFMASGNIMLMGVSLLIAVTAAIIAVIILIKVYGKRIQLFNKIILKDATTTEEGYVSNIHRLDLVGKEGVALTTLRPSGTAVIDGERVDVVTEGGYIDKDKKIIVFKVEGPRIVVRENK